MKEYTRKAVFRNEEDLTIKYNEENPVDVLAIGAVKIIDTVSRPYLKCVETMFDIVSVPFGIA